MSTYYFVNKNAPNGSSIIKKAINGKYGFYCKADYPYESVNLSEKKMRDRGYSFECLSKDEANKLLSQQEDNRIRINREMTEQKLNDRAKQVDICLAAKPIEISLKKGEICETANLSNTPMIDAYHGCGKGTAYVKDGNIVAWHYGYDKPANAPQLDSVRVELSCTQICFA